MSCEGDVRLIPAEDGGEVSFSGGQPEMDPGLQTAVYLSLFTRPGWWGNAIAEPGEEIGCPLESLYERTLSAKARLDAEEHVRGALQWMLDDGVAESVAVESEIPALGMLALRVTIAEPGGEQTSLRYRINWAEQRVQMEVA